MKAHLFCYPEKEADRAVRYLKNKHPDIHVYFVSEEKKDRFAGQATWIDPGCSVQEVYRQIRTALAENVKPGDPLYLLLTGSSHLYENVLLHVISQEYGKTAKFLRMDQELTEWELEVYDSSNDWMEPVRELISSGNFRSARKLLQTGDVPRFVMQLLEFGEKLKKLDVRKLEQEHDSFDVLAGVLRNMEAEEEAISYVEGMKKLRERDQVAFLYYLHNYLEYLYKENDLIEFLVLYYRLAEELLLYTIGLDIDWEQEHPQFVRRKNALFALDFSPNDRLTRHHHKYLQLLTKKIRSLENKYRIKVRRDKPIPTAPFTKEERYFVELYYEMNDIQLEKFLKLRHEGVSGHGFADFSKEKFQSYFNGATPLEKIEPLLEKYGVKPDYNMFELVQKSILFCLSHNQQLLQEEQALKATGRNHPDVFNSFSSKKGL
jgi:hypothetical protein